MAVRPARAAASASCTAASDSESRWAVASSRITTAGPGQQQPGDGEPLALAAEKPVAALPHHRVEAVGQRRDELIEPGLARASHRLVVGGVRAGEEQVVARSVSWNRWPSWVTTPTAVRSASKRQVAHVDAAERTAPPSTS